MFNTVASHIWLLALGLLCYFVVSLYFAVALKTGKRIKRIVVLPIIVLGLLFHGLSLYPQLAVPNGLNFSVFNTISLTTWLMVSFSLLFTLYRPIIVLNVLAAPLAAVGLLAGFYAHHTQHLQSMSLTQGAGFGLGLHIVFSIAAYCVFFMAAMQALLLLLQNRELKHKSQTRLWVKLLPALQTMESLLFDMLVLGFALLSFALSLGAVTVQDFFAQHLAHKTFFSILAWLLFAWLIYGHWRFGWRGRRAAGTILWGFALLALGFIGSKAVLELLLR